MDGQDQNTDMDSMFPTRGKRTIVLLSALVPTFLFVVYAAVLALDPDGQWRLTVGVQRINLPRSVGLAMFLPGVGLMLVVMGGVLRAGLRGIWAAPPGPKGETFVPILEDEASLWRGKPGLRSFVSARVVLTCLFALIPLLFGWWLWSALSGDAPLVSRLFFAWIPILFFCSSAMPILVLLSGPAADWVRDAFGTIAITDRRIVWLTPRLGQVYREIPAAEVVDASIMESDGRRGALFVIRRITCDVEYVELVGIPDPESALAAVLQIAGT